jgi:hypothetical protein
MKHFILAGIVAAAIMVPTVTAALVDDPFGGDTPIGHAEFQTICLEIDGLLGNSPEGDDTCTYEISTPFSEERQIGAAGPVWTISGTTTDTFVATWHTPIDITTEQTEGEPVVTSCVNQHGQPINLHSANCQL